MVSSTASGDTGEVGNAAAPGHRRRRGEQGEPDGNVVDGDDLTGRPQVSMTPESQTSFSNSVSPDADRGPDGRRHPAPRPRSRGSAPEASRWSSSTVAPALASHRSLLTCPCSAARVGRRDPGSPRPSPWNDRPHQDRCPGRLLRAAGRATARPVTGRRSGCPVTMTRTVPAPTRHRCSPPAAQSTAATLEVFHDGQQPGPAHPAIRATHRRDASLGDPGSVRRRQPAGGGVAGRRDAVPAVAAAGIARRRGRRAGRRGRSGRAAVRVRAGHPASCASRSAR